VRYSGDTGRDALNVFLFVPRHVVKFLFWGASVAIGVIEKQPIVPRAQEVVSSHGGRFAILPTLFAETGSPFDVGARMIVDFGAVATGLRVGFGGIHYFEIEPRVAFQLDVPVRSVLAFEGLYKVDNNRVYGGVGQDPASDRRNHFQPLRAGASGHYLEERARWIGSYAVRLHHDFEVLLSGSLDRRTVSDSVGADEDALSRVFVPGSVPGAFESRRTVYAESAGCLDTRATRGRPSSGFLAEGYAGTGHEIDGHGSVFVRAGGRAAAYIPLYRKTNILSPKLVLDGIAQAGTVPISFNELAGEPDFRGYDERRDHLSLVASLDYRWLIVEHVGASLFFDTQVVAAGFDAFDFGALRWVGGVGLDLHSDDLVLGQLSLAAGNGGLRLVFERGVSNGYGDRQHRD